MQRSVLFLFMALITNVTNAAQPNWLNPSFIERAFIHVALRNEYSVGEKPLVKWRKPIKIWIKHKVGDRALHDQLVNEHLEHLRRVTGHSITRVNSRNEANVIWVFTRQASWQQDIRNELGENSVKHMHGAVCQAGYKTDSTTHEILSAAIVIPVDQARSHGKLVACIVEEITQSLGLPNDSEYAYPSIFNDRTPEDLLSPLDVVLLKLLYSPELTSGMSERQAKPVIKALIKSYQQQGLLEQAVSIANSAPLKKWM